MKLLLAASHRNLERAIKQDVRVEIDITNVTNTDAVLNALADQRFDYIISEYAIDDVDVWGLSTLINKQDTYSICVDEGTCEIEIPPLLAKEYRLMPLPLTELCDWINEGKTLSFHRKASLLIIEDDQAAADIAKHALDAYYHINLAYQGDEGLSLWEKQRHDLVLLDLMLPSLSGYDVLNAIMAIDHRQPIVIITAYGTEHDHRSLIINGASEVLPKPYTIQELREICQRMHGRAKLNYQQDYIQSKFKFWGEQLWLLEHYLAHHETVKMRRVLTTMRSTLPKSMPSDDEVFELLKSESTK